MLGWGVQAEWTRIGDPSVGWMVMSGSSWNDFCTENVRLRVDREF